MPQAKGAASRLIMQRMLTSRTPPAAAARVIPFSTFDLKRDPRLQNDPTITNSPLPAKSDKGNPVASGPFTSIFDLRSIGNWLQLLFGAPTTGKAVTSQPVNITGVNVLYASSDCTAGAGTLTYVSAAKTLTWTPQGGTAGTAVDVTAGGNFTLQGGGGGKAITIAVTASALPGGNQSDATINVSATLKGHLFPIDLTDRPFALIERQHSDISKYYRWLDVHLNKLSWDIIAAEQNIQGELIAGIEVDPVPTAAFDANPTVYDTVRASAAGGVVSNGATGLGTVTGGTIEVLNSIAGFEAADGLEGYSGFEQGDLMMSGALSAVFDGAGAYQLARDLTSTRLRLESKKVVGSDTFGLYVDMPAVELAESLPPIDKKSGLFARLNWKAHGDATLPAVVLINDVTGY